MSIVTHYFDLAEMVGKPHVRFNVSTQQYDLWADDKVIYSMSSDDFRRFEGSCELADELQIQSEDMEV